MNGEWGMVKGERWKGNGERGTVKGERWKGRDERWEGKDSTDFSSNTVLHPIGTNNIDVINAPHGSCTLYRPCLLKKYVLLFLSPQKKLLIKTRAFKSRNDET